MSLLVTFLFNGPHLRIHSLELEFQHYGPFTKEEIARINDDALHAAMVQYGEVAQFHLLGIIPMAVKDDSIVMSASTLEDIE